MIRVQYARRHHVKIGFKGLKDESFEDKSEEVENSNDITSTQMVFATPEEEK